MKKIILVVFLTFCIRLTGFLREIFLSNFFGASFITDAFLISLVIPSVLFSLVGAGISTSYIPVYENIKAKYGENGANKFTNDLLIFLFFICTFIIVIVYFNTNKIICFFMNNIENKNIELVNKFLKISILTLYFSSIIFIFTSFAQIKNIYKNILGFSLVPNLLVLVSIFYATKKNIYFLPFGNFIGLFLQAFLIYKYIRLYEFKFKFSFKLDYKFLQKYFKLTLPIILGISVDQINIIVDKNIASKSFVGAITILSYSEKINSLVHGIIIMSIINLIYPILSNSYQINKDIFSKKSIEVIELLVFVLLPIVLGIQLFSEEIIFILFGRGKFTKNDIILTSELLKIYSMSLLFYGLKEIIIRIMYILGKVKFVVIVSILGVTLNIVLNIIFSKSLGLKGLALATTISTIVTSCALVIYFIYKMKIKVDIIKKISAYILKHFIISYVLVLLLKQILIKLKQYFKLEISLLLLLILIIIIFSGFFKIYFLEIKEKLKLFNNIQGGEGEIHKT